MAVKITRVFDLLQYNLENFPKNEFVSGKIAGQWRHYSTKEFCDCVDALSRGLVDIGVEKESRVAVMSPNRPEWNISDFAIMQLGAYQIPLYPTLAEHDIQYILEDAEITVVFVADQILYQKLKPVCEASEREIQIYTFDKIAGAAHWGMLTSKGKSLDKIDLDSYRNKVTAGDILTLIYTSGTTGTPKGVMLTHNNLVKNFENSSVLLPKGIQKGLSFLPLSHIFERMVVYLYMNCGTSVYYAESMETIVADIQHIKPNVFSTVPRLLEKVYEKIMEKGKALSGAKRGLFFWSVGLGEIYDFGNDWCLDWGSHVSWFSRNGRRHLAVTL
jgi:long-chain acyl-CoA synthetase